MKYYVLAIVFIVILILSVSFSTTTEINNVAVLAVSEMNIPDVTAPAWGVVDLMSGKIIAGENIDIVVPIASVNKLFVAHTLYESPYLESSTIITTEDLRTEGESGSLEQGQEYVLKELLFPLLLVSSNDAGAAIQRTLFELDETVDYKKLTEGLRLSATNINGFTGLSPSTVSTVRDLSQFLYHVFYHGRHVLDITRLQSYLGKENGWMNNNPAIEYATFIGGKHGYTNEAGRTFVGIFSISYTGGERPLGLILLGSENISEDIALLHDYITNEITYE